MPLSKSEIKLIRSLDKKRERDKSGLFIVEGEKLYREAVDSGWIVESVFYREEIGEEMMSKISHLTSPSPVLAIVRKPQDSEVTLPVSNELYLVLDSIRDPGNMGTIIRLCEWFGVKSLYCSLDCVDIYNPKVVQSTMGSLFRVNVQVTDLHYLISKHCSDIPVYGTFLSGSNIYSEELTCGGVVVLGSESSGISGDLESLMNKKLYIPSFSREEKGGESLNVAIAAAVVCSEFRRTSALPLQIK